MSGNLALASEVAAEFCTRFGGRPRVFRAPGRVNLIGEHTDYNDGFVMPAAIELGTCVAIAPRPDKKMRVASTNFNDERSFSIDDNIAPSHHWTDYPIGVAHMLRQHGIRLPGADILVKGDIPVGAGLSSSAALEVATAVGLLAISDQEMSREEIARLCQRAENEFVGAHCGIMDQFICANAVAGHALMLDCRSLHSELLAVPSDISIVIANTMVKHSVAGGEYNARRAQCENGVQILRQHMPGILSLRDVELAELERYRATLPGVIYRRCRHVVTENQRVLQFASSLKNNDLARAGELMCSSHASLRDDYEVSCRELDTMVEIARAAGAIGSRMTGGGFGGCTVSLVCNKDVGEFQAAVSRNYEAAVGVRPEIYVTQTAGAVEEIAL